MPAEPLARKCGQKEFVRIVVPSMNSVFFRSVERSRQFVNQSGISASALLEPQPGSLCGMEVAWNRFLLNRHAAAESILESVALCIENPYQLFITGQQPFR